MDSGPSEKEVQKWMLEAEEEKEATRIRKSKIEGTEEYKDRHINAVIKNSFNLMEFVPNHEGLGCTDDEPFNAYNGYCTRCYLIRAFDCQSIPEGVDIKVKIEVKDSTGKIL